jgi:hypothetical protein
MFTIRNLGGVALFLFGTTYLWLTPMFASEGVSTKGLDWSITNVMAYATIVGFTIATVGLFRKATWWEGAAIASAIVGLIVLIPYWIAAHSSGETTPRFNVLIHAICAIAVLVIHELAGGKVIMLWRFAAPQEYRAVVRRDQVSSP